MSTGGVFFLYVEDIYQILKNYPSEKNTISRQNGERKKVAVVSNVENSNKNNILVAVNL